MIMATAATARAIHATFALPPVLGAIEGAVIVGVTAVPAAEGAGDDEATGVGGTVAAELLCVGADIAAALGEGVPAAGGSPCTMAVGG